MKVGDRVYYTGDQANFPSAGTITDCIPASKYISESVRIKWDDKRFEGDDKMESVILIISFSSGPGRRFWMMDEWEEKRREEIAAFQKKYNRKEA